MTAKSVAKAFWLASAKQPIVGLYNLSSAVQVLKPYVPAQLEQANDALEASLTKRGIATDLDSLVTQLDVLKSSSLEFWGGSYLLQARSGELFQLCLSDGTAQLLSSDMDVLIDVPFEKLRFEAQNLAWEDDKVKLDLKFYFPSDLPQNAQLALEQQIDKDEASLGGEFQVKSGVPKDYQIVGKRNVCTVAGLKHEGYGDPLEVWVGSYAARYVDGDFAYISDITVSAASDGSVFVKYGDTPATDAALGNNTLVFTLSPPFEARFALNLLCSPNGVRTFNGIRNFQGHDRPVVGTARTPYASAKARLSQRSSGDELADPPDFCATNIDQQVALSSLGNTITPTQPYPPLTVTYADGTTGTVQITPVRAEDTYKVPEGAFVVYHELGPDNQPLTTDASLKVGWRLATPFRLLSMVESAYYQMRLTVSDWSDYDTSGIGITLARDDGTVKDFIALTWGIHPKCGSGTGGGASPVTDFTKATALIAAKASAEGYATRTYEFELSGKSSVSDNAAGDHNGFLCAKLNFKAADGSTKFERTVLIPMLLGITLPIAIRPLPAVAGAATFAAGYAGHEYVASLGGEGGVQPYEWKTVTAPPAGLSWKASDDAAKQSYVLSGKFDSEIKNGVYLSQVTLQSDRSAVVSRPLLQDVAFTVGPAPVDLTVWAPLITAGSIGVIAGVATACLRSTLDGKSAVKLDPGYKKELIAVASVLIERFDRTSTERLKIGYDWVESAIKVNNAQKIADTRSDLQTVSELLDNVRLELDSKQISRQKALDDFEYVEAARFLHEIEALIVDTSRLIVEKKNLDRQGIILDSRPGI